MKKNIILQLSLEQFIGDIKLLIEILQLVSNISLISHVDLNSKTIQNNLKTLLFQMYNIFKQFHLLFPSNQITYPHIKNQKHLKFQQQLRPTSHTTMKTNTRQTIRVSSTASKHSLKYKLSTSTWRQFFVNCERNTLSSRNTRSVLKPEERARNMINESASSLLTPSANKPKRPRAILVFDNERINQAYSEGGR